MITRNTFYKENLHDNESDEKKEEIAELSLPPTLPVMTVPRGKRLYTISPSSSQENLESMIIDSLSTCTNPFLELKLWKNDKKLIQNRSAFARILNRYFNIDSKNSPSFLSLMINDPAFNQLIITHLKLAEKCNRFDTVSLNRNFQVFVTYINMLHSAAKELKTSITDFTIQPSARRDIFHYFYLNEPFLSEKNKKFILDSEEKIKNFLLAKYFLLECDRKIENLNSSEYTYFSSYSKFQQAENTLVNLKETVNNLLSDYFESNEENAGNEFHDRLFQAMDNNDSVLSESYKK
ncbi:MAG: hypothetical protein ACE365_04620 [Gammaproteobacteria bacterium]